MPKTASGSFLIQLGHQAKSFLGLRDRHLDFAPATVLVA